MLQSVVIWKGTDASRDANDILQLATFKIVEEMATLLPVKGTTKAADVYTALQNTLKTYQL
jgi:hypothetical protein